MAIGEEGLSGKLENVGIMQDKLLCLSQLQC